MMILKHGKLARSASRVLITAGLIGVAAYSQASDQQVSNASDDEQKNAKIRRIDQLMHKNHALGQFQGAVLVAMRGEVIYRKAFGLANVEWNLPNTPQTKYRIASHGKGFTAVLIMQLVEQGLLDLHTPIARYLPAYRKDNGQKITLHHLLSHTSGIPGVPQEWIDTNYRNPYTLAQLVELANQAQLQFEPGTKFVYCNNGYNLLAAIIENVTGKTYVQVLHDRILDPLGMADTGLVKHRPILKGRAANYDRMFWGAQVNAEYMDETFAVGAGGMYSTVDDMFKWDRALHGETLLSQKSKQIMYTPGLSNSGYGCAIGRYVKGDGSTHTFVIAMGGTNGAASVSFRLLDDEHFIVALGNIRQIPQGRLASNITNILVDIPVNPIPKPLDNKLHRMVIDQGLEAALEQYRGMLARDVPGLPRETRINQMGYQLLRYGRVTDAVRLFQFNTRAYPDSWNAYDSLGEALVAAGDCDSAIRNYQKSLELNPENNTGRQTLKRLQEQAR